MRTSSALQRIALLLSLGVPLAVRAQEHPARRVASIVAVAVEEYGKAVDPRGRLISAQEYGETRDFLRDARTAAERLSGATAASARALLDSLSAAVQSKRPPALLDSLEVRFASVLGSEASLELPVGPNDLVQGKEIFERTCASCHGARGLGDGESGLALTPRPPAIGTSQVMRDAVPAMTYRIVSVGIAGTPMTGYGNVLTSQQRWNVVSYVNSLRTSHAQQMEGEGLYSQRCASCHGIAGAADGALARSLTKLPPEIGTTSWQVQHSDVQLGEVVLHGIRGTAMPPAPDLSDEQVSSIVAYVRTLPTKDHPNVAAGKDGDRLNPVRVGQQVVSQLEQALDAARGGRAADAGDKAFDAYIAFEPLEGPARAKNPGLVSSMERKFAEFKAAVRSNDVRGAEGARDAIEATLSDVIALSAPAGSGIEAFWQSFLIILREGFEAILVVGAVVAFLIKTGHRDRLRNIWAGVAIGVLASAVTAVILQTILSAVPASKEFVEGVSLLLAVFVLFSVSYWLISRVEAAKWQQFIKEKVSAALEGGGGSALTFVAFLAVYREGAETALFYQALFHEGQNVALPIALGIAVGFVALAVIFTLFFRFGVMIPLRPFFSVTSVLLYYMAFVFMGKGIKELQEGDLIPLSAIHGFPSVEWLGLFPTWQGVMSQLALLLLFAFAVLKTFWPKRSVSLPIVQQPARASASALEQQLAAMHAEQDELRRRLSAVEEVVGREPAQG